MACAVSGPGGGEIGAGVAGAVAERESTMYRSRNYQLEMLEASLKENVIIAVGVFLDRRDGQVLTGVYRWIRGVGRLMCMFGLIRVTVSELSSPPFAHGLPSWTIC